MKVTDFSSLNASRPRKLSALNADGHWKVLWHLLKKGVCVFTSCSGLKMVCFSASLVRNWACFHVDIGLFCCFQKAWELQMNNRIEIFWLFGNKEQLILKKSLKGCTLLQGQMKSTVSGITPHMLKIWKQLIHCKEKDQLLKEPGVIDQVILIFRYQSVGENILYLP